MLVAFDDQQRTLAWNHECERVTGYQAQEMIGKPDAYQLLFGVGAKVDGIALGKRPVQERPITCKNKSVRHVAWLSMSRELTLPGWSQCWVDLDVTEHRQTVERVWGLFDSSTDALAFTTLQGAFLEANRAFLALTDRTREEILDMTYQSLTQAEYRARNAEVVDQLVKTGRPSSTRNISRRTGHTSVSRYGCFWFADQTGSRSVSAASSNRRQRTSGNLRSRPWGYNHRIWPGCVKRRNS